MMSSECEIVNVDISNEDILERILNYLKDYFPETLYIYHLLWNIQRHFISIDHIHPEIFLNDLKEIKSIVIIYSIYGFSNRNQQETNYWKLINFHCDNQSIDLVESMIKKCFPLNTSKKFYITAHGKRFLPIIERFYQENSLQIEYCSMMEIDRSTLEKVKSQIKDVPHDIDFRQLSLEDAHLINDCWEYKSEDSFQQIKYQIEHFPTIGAYRDKELLSWRLLQYNGSLGMAHTIEKERRQGLSSILNSKLAEQIFQIQDHVFCTVVRNNLSSIQLLTKLGYQQVSDEYWIFP